MPTETSYYQSNGPSRDTRRHKPRAPAHGLAILVVTRNSAHGILRLLDGLRPGVRPADWQLIVVDNASRDGSAELVAAQHPWVTLVRSPRDLGFAGAVNLAASRADAHILLLLDPRVSATPACIAQGLQRMWSEPGVGIAGGRLLGDDGSDRPSARRFPSLLNEALALSGLAARFPRSRLCGRADRTCCDPAVPAEVDWVPGAFAFVRTTLFAALGGFDLRFFRYYEEVDLCRRARGHGYTVQYWPELRVRHAGGDLPGAGAQLTPWHMRSALLYHRKHHGWLTAWASNRLASAWHGLRALRHWRFAKAGGARGDKYRQSRQHVAQLRRAWHDTMGGRVSPPTPW
ncbi:MULTISPECIES: glycosyltransferase family 2 protein [Cupriavidus]|uniref:glycosyltransferase family 2 protein n=1 Tax=Cupriavidus TaxID=106589 RepID=UPI0009F72ED4|nr:MULTISPECIES: glycosyltransferase family 2 protein [Cupriavidus]